MKTILRGSLMLTVAIVATAITAIAATALPPTLITGTCPAGSARATKWIMFEDLNGDGTYDWVTQGDCNGVVRGHQWKVSGDPDQQSPDDVIVGQLPSEVVGAVNPSLSYTQESGGLYSWTITEHLSTGEAICSYSRNADMSLSSTCPPDTKFH